MGRVAGWVRGGAGTSGRGERVERARRLEGGGEAWGGGEEGARRGRAWSGRLSGLCPAPRTAARTRTHTCDHTHPQHAHPPACCRNLPACGHSPPSHSTTPHPHTPNCLLQKLDGLQVLLPQVVRLHQHEEALGLGGQPRLRRLHLAALALVRLQAAPPAGVGRWGREGVGAGRRRGGGGRRWEEGEGARRESGGQRGCEETMHKHSIPPPTPTHRHTHMHTHTHTHVRT